MAYEKYATEEQTLKIKAVEALRRHEQQLFGKVKDIEASSEEAKQNRWSRPKVKMMRLSADQLAGSIEEDDRRLAMMEQEGAEIDKAHQRFIEESRAEQEIANAHLRRFIREGNTEGVNELAQAQTKFDHKVHKRIDERYKRERVL